MDILVAHAADEARAALTSCLAAMDVTVVETGDGERARDLLRRADGPSVALLDWHLPGMTGLDVCRELREDVGTRPLYLMVVAPAAHKCEAAAAAAAGADDFVWTPVSGDDLRARVAFARAVLATRPAAPLEGDDTSLRCFDPVTLVHDRAQMVRRLEEELARARRERVTVGVSILDVDGLGPVNAEFGREVGDEVLREVARRLKGTLRPYDVVGRLQSDEFLIITPRTGEYDIGDALDRVRRAMTARPFCHGDQCLAVTVTLGGVTGAEESAEELIAMAHPVLGEAKEAGGDSVVAGVKAVLESVLTNQWSS